MLFERVAILVPRSAFVKKSDNGTSSPNVIAFYLSEALQCSLMTPFKIPPESTSDTTRRYMKFVQNIRIAVTSVALLILAGLFLQRAAEWQKGLTGDFIVYGQTGGPGLIPSGFTGKVIPDVAAGTLGNITYSTHIQVVNSGSSTVHVSGNFFNDN